MAPMQGIFRHKPFVKTFDYGISVALTDKTEQTREMKVKTMKTEEKEAAVKEEETDPTVKKESGEATTPDTKGSETKPLAKRKKGKEEDKIPVKANRGTKKSFQEWVAKCRVFKEKRGHCKIPTSGKKVEKSLGIFVQEVRRNYKLLKSGKTPRRVLTQEQIDALDALGFHWGFTPDPNACAETDQSWDTHFAQLQEYQQIHDGDCNVPLGYGTLGPWVRVQRMQYYRRSVKLKCFINKKRISKLDGIGFSWDGERKAT